MKKLLKWISAIGLLIAMFTSLNILNNYMLKLNVSYDIRIIILVITILLTFFYIIKLDTKIENKIDDIFK